MIVMDEKHMRLVIEVHKDLIELSLRRGNDVVETVKLESAYALAEDLLPAVDGLLAKRNLKSQDIQDFEVESTLPEGYSARRIAETTAKVFMSAAKA